MSITTTISQFPPAPSAGSDTPEQFSNKADAFVAHQEAPYVNEVNAWATQANATAAAINTDATDAATSETNAANSASSASISATVSTDKAAEAAASAASVNLPTITTGDAGKILQVKADETGYKFIDNQGGGGVIAGVIFDFAGVTAPTGSLACNGQEVSKTTYAVLYAAIGDVWATTGGVTAPSAGNFRVPPQEIGGLGLYNRGVGATNGAVGTYEADVYKSHNHGLSTTSPLTATSGSTGFMLSSAAPNSQTSISGDPTETRPRSITVLKCIWTGA